AGAAPRGLAAQRARDRRREGRRADGVDPRARASRRADRRHADGRVPAEPVVPPRSGGGAEERDAAPRRAARPHRPHARARVRPRRGRRGRGAPGRADRRGRDLPAREGHLRREGDRVSGGMDLNKLLEQAQQMQAQVQKAQEEIQNETVEGTAGGGAVKVTATGGGKITAIEIAKEAIDPDDPEGLADLVLAAVNNALENAETLAKSKLNLGALGDLGSLGLGF